MKRNHNWDYNMRRMETFCDIWGITDIEYVDWFMVSWDA